MRSRQLDHRSAAGNRASFAAHYYTSRPATDLGGNTRGPIAWLTSSLSLSLSLSEQMLTWAQ
jgi:hypothetical protein